jgi:hypothetical protein
MIRKIFAVVIFITISCFSQEFSHLKNYGIEYSFYQYQNPRPLRIHVLKIDFSKQQVEPVVSLADDPDGNGPAEAQLTNPLALAKDKNILAFINTNPWDSFPDKKGKRNRHWYECQPVDIQGLAATKGKIISPAGDGCVSVWVDKSGKFHISQFPDTTQLSEGMAGWYQIVKEGKIIPKQDNTLNPFTGIGIDETGYVVWFVVADGRQKGFSEGITHFELADFMLKLGCWNVALMDGGGSSIMALMDEKGKLKIVNSPSDRTLGFIKRIRPLPLILTIRLKQN